MPQPTEQIGGYYFGQGKKTVTNSTSVVASLPATAPLTNITAAKLNLSVTLGGSGTDVDETWLRKIDLNDQQIVLNISTTTDALASGPIRWAAAGSVIQPYFGLLVDIQDSLDVGLINTDAGDNYVTGAWQAAVMPGGSGIETSARAPGSKTGMGRIVNMGVTDSPGGTATEEYSGNINTANALSLQHFNVQAVDTSPRVQVLRIDDLDLVTTGSGGSSLTSSAKGVPISGFSELNSWFSLKGRIVDKTNTMQVTFYMDADNSIGSCFTAYVAS